MDVAGPRETLARRDALLHAARRCAAEASSEAVLRTLLEEAVSLVGAEDGGVARWEPARRQLVQVESYNPSENTGAVLDLERSASGRAAVSRQPVIVNDYQREGDPNSPAGRLGVKAGLAVPLVHEGRLIGTLSVNTFDSNKKFDEEDAASLELLAGIGASALIGRERAELEGALTVRNQLLAEVSHDLRTPLTAARGQVQLLQRDIAGVDEPLRERLGRGLERVDRAIARMTQLIDLLRDAALLEAGQPLDLRRRPIDLVELARAEVEEFRQLAPSHRLRLVAPGSLIGLWDPGRLERVLDNLIDNAVKYSPEGRTITVTLRRDGDWATLTVRDRGIGIPAGDLDRVFDRFFRAANVGGRIKGTGIGLAGARQIVAQHGGSITVESHEAHGSAFTVRLPIDAEDGPDDLRLPVDRTAG